MERLLRSREDDRRLPRDTFSSSSGTNCCVLDVSARWSQYDDNRSELDFVRSFGDDLVFEDDRFLRLSSLDDSSPGVGGRRESSLANSSEDARLDFDRRLRRLPVL